MKYHPDRNQGDKAIEEKFKEITEAYNTLGNEGRKAEYDKKLNGNFEKTKQQNTRTKESTQKNKEFNFEDIEKNFENFFGFNPKTNEMKKKKKKKNPLDTSDIFNEFFKV